MGFLQGILASLLAKILDKLWSVLSRFMDKKIIEKVQNDKVDAQLNAVENAKYDLKAARIKQKQLKNQKLDDPKVEKEVKDSEEKLIDASRHLLRHFWY